jgi:hypothetical protein
MIDALSIVGNESTTSSSSEEKTILTKFGVENFRTMMVTSGKENGENLLDHYVTEIIADCKLVHEEFILIEDFAQYLMSK